MVSSTLRPAGYAIAGPPPGVLGLRATFVSAVAAVLVGQLSAGLSRPIRSRLIAAARADECLVARGACA